MMRNIYRMLAVLAVVLLSAPIAAASPGRLGQAAPPSGHAAIVWRSGTTAVPSLGGGIAGTAHTPPFLSPNAHFSALKSQPTSAPAAVPVVPLAGAPAARTQAAATSAETPSETAATSSSTGNTATLSQFPVMSQQQQISTVGSDQAVQPPDTQLAAGPNHVVEMINDSGSVWSKSGQLQSSQSSPSPFDLNKFFSAPSGYTVADPRILYDAASGRWFASALLFNSSYDSMVKVAVASSATGNWTFYTVSSNTGGVLYDQPKLGVSNDKVIISWNDFTGSTFTGSETWVLQKSDLLAGNAQALSYHFGPDTTRFNVVPSQSLSSTNTDWLVYNNSDGKTGSENYVNAQGQTVPTLGIVAITGTPSQNNVTWTESDPAITPTAPPPNAVQPNSTTPVDTNDDRLLNAVWQNGILWTGANDGVVPPNDTTTRSGLRLIQVNTSGSTPTVTQNFDAAVAGTYLYFPAVTMDQAGNLFVAFSWSSANQYPTAAASGQINAPSDVNTLAPMTTVATGLGVYSGGRWGDYSAAAPDPAVPTDVWIGAEYTAAAGTGTDWGTSAARLTFSPPAVSGVSPDFGWANQSGSVTITGSDFVAGQTQVRFGSAASPSVTVNSPTQLTASVPALSAQTVDITVSTPEGTSPVGLADQYAYATLPTAPTNVVARAGNGDVSLSWSAPSSTGGIALTQYVVTGSDGQSWAVAGSATQLTIPGLVNGTPYTFTVAAENGLGSGPASAPVAVTPGTEGYWLVAQDGGIFSFGNAPFYGSTGNIRLNKPIVGMAPTPDGHGYWLVAQDGGVFAFGDAAFYGSTGNIRLNKPIVGMASTPDGRGYWLVAQDGGVFAFGDAAFYGSTGNIRLNKPIVGMASTPDGHGYWLVAQDGGVFAFGDAAFYGSTGNIRLNKPIVGMASTPDGRGYWLVAQDGGVFAFGDAAFYGSTGNIRLNKPIVGMASTPDGRGYWLVAQDGGVFAFGDAPFYGSTGNIRLNKPIVGMAP